jgi:peptidoglycan/xylan/chitin deacetylase (PgdA/CDA1 family)
MSVTRGDFLKSLGKSLPGMILGGTAAKAAHSILGKMAAASSASYPPETKPSRSALTAPVAPAVPFIRNGPSTSNRIALTFDDGPTPGVTERILDELKQRRLHATFFMIGERIAAAPDLARRVLAEGHDVGNHTYTHPHLTRLSDEQVELEIEKTEQIMARELNHRAAWLRPPYGALRQNQVALVARRNL